MAIRFDMPTQPLRAWRCGPDIVAAYSAEEARRILVEEVCGLNEDVESEVVPFEGETLTISYEDSPPPSEPLPTKAQCKAPIELHDGRWTIAGPVAVTAQTQAWLDRCPKPCVLALSER